MRYQQASLWETLFAEEVGPWMRAVDELLEDQDCWVRCTASKGSGARKATLADGIRRRQR